MPREISIEMPFAMGAEEFWALRMDRNFDVFCGARDQPRLQPYRHTDPRVPLTCHAAPLPPLSRHAAHTRLPPTRALLYPAHHDKMNYHPESNEVTIDAEGLVYVQQRNRLQARWHASTGPGPRLLSLTTSLLSVLQMKENPVPKSVRSMVGSGDDFSYRVHYRFHRDAFDEAHPFRYTTEFPVLSERIKVEGRQWLVPISPRACTFRAVIQLSILVSGEG